MDNLIGLLYGTPENIIQIVKHLFAFSSATIKKWRDYVKHVFAVYFTQVKQGIVSAHYQVLKIM